MQWLMAHMWTALAAAGVLGLLFGWSMRGLGLRGKLRRAEGERNIALGSLQEKETELEALYAAGRTPAASEGIIANDDELKRELDERELKLQSLSDELARSKAELAELRENGGSSGALEGAALGAVVGAVASNASTDEDGADDVATAKLKWQNEYLRQRLQFLEVNAGADTAARVDLTAPAGVAEASTPQVASDANVTGDDDLASDEEIAKLRWRNRYLEGRLAYYEGDKSEEENTADSGIVGLAASTAAAIIESEDADDDVDFGNLDLDTEPEAETDIESETVVETETPAQEANEAPVGEQPMSLEGPVGGEGDDLTAIGGIGPKIQEVLNELGIYHYDQIAAWSKENIDWIDEHLAFEGRIEREQWVEQAAVLSGDA